MERLAARFWKYVDKNGPVHPVLSTRCWLWTGAGQRNGYGQITICRDGRKTVEYVHRIALEIDGRPLVAGQYGLHRCDVKRCVNPEHLFIGSKRDNTMDAVYKGRLTKKLTIEQVREMRETYRLTRREDRRQMCAAFAERFGINVVYAGRIARGQHWSWI